MEVTLSSASQSRTRDFCLHNISREPSDSRLVVFGTIIRSCNVILLESPKLSGSGSEPRNPRLYKWILDLLYLGFEYELDPRTRFHPYTHKISRRFCDYLGFYSFRRRFCICKCCRCSVCSFFEPVLLFGLCYRCGLFGIEVCSYA